MSVNTFNTNSFLSTSTNTQLKRRIAKRILNVFPWRSTTDNRLFLLDYDDKYDPVSFWDAAASTERNHKPSASFSPVCLLGNQSSSSLDRLPVCTVRVQTPDPCATVFLQVCMWVWVNILINVNMSSTACLCRCGNRSMFYILYILFKGKPIPCADTKQQCAHCILLSVVCIQGLLCLNSLSHGASLE